MCFFERTDYNCGDWKWGVLKETCDDARQTGYPCTSKLLHSPSQIIKDNPCLKCEQIAPKGRRVIDMQNRLAYLKGQIDLDPSIIENLEGEIAETHKLIHDLQQKRTSVLAGGKPKIPISQLLMPNTYEPRAGTLPESSIRKILDRRASNPKPAKRKSSNPKSREDVPMHDVLN